MILDYIGVKEINGSLIVLDGVKDASFEEIVDIRLDDGSLRQGRIVQMEGDRVVVQVFEGTRGISLANTRTRLMGHPMELALSPEILGRVFDGAGRPIDGLGDVFPVMRRNINGTLGRWCKAQLLLTLLTFSELLIGSEVVSSGVEVLVGSLVELSLLEVAGAHPTSSASAEAAIPIIRFFIDDSWMFFNMVVD